MKNSLKFVGAMKAYESFDKLKHGFLKVFKVDFLCASNKVTFKDLVLSPDF